MAKILNYKELTSVDAHSLARLTELSQIAGSSVCGVYFLFDGEGSIIYIGMSQNIKRRMSAHKAAGKYANFAYVEVFEAQRVGNFLRYLEAYFIQKYLPSQNQSGKRADPDAMSVSAFNDAALTVLAQREYLQTRPQYRNKSNWI